MAKKMKFWEPSGIALENNHYEGRKVIVNSWFWVQSEKWNEFIPLWKYFYSPLTETKRTVGNMLHGI